MFAYVSARSFYIRAVRKRMTDDDQNAGKQFNVWEFLCARRCGKTHSYYMAYWDYGRLCVYLDEKLLFGKWKFALFCLRACVCVGIFLRTRRA